MSKIDEYRTALRQVVDWDTFLMEKSGLPGPRGNIELAQAAADEGTEELFHGYLSLDPDQAPTNSPREFLAFCGVVGLGRLLSEGRTEFFGTLRFFASDSRWRIREGVAMALQRLGDHNMELLTSEMEDWSNGTALEQRAAAAGLCEPRLLRDQCHIARVFQILDRITSSVALADDRKSEAFRVLRKGLAYCWSVAVVASPELGKSAIERWFTSEDKDITWIMRENLKKERLSRMDAGWVETWKSRLSDR